MLDANNSSHPLAGVITAKVGVRIFEAAQSYGRNRLMLRVTAARKPVKWVHHRWY
jgi:hypothetical protein